MAPADPIVARERISVALYAIRKTWPYLSKAVGALVWHPDPDDTATASVTAGGVCRYNPTFVLSLSEAEVAAVILHEAMHPLRDHAARGQATGADGQTCNVAADCEINDDLRDMGAKLPKGALYPEAKGWPVGATMEEYIGLSRQGPQKGQDGPGKPNPGKGQGKGQGQGQGQSGQGKAQGDEGDDAEGQGKGAKGQGKGKPGFQAPDGAQGEGCGSGAGAPRPGDEELDREYGRGERAMANVRRQVAQDVQRASSNGRGTVPAGLRQWANGVLSPPKIPWQAKLQGAIRQAQAYRAGQIEPTYRKISRKQAGLGFGPGAPIMRAWHAPVPHVAIILDTSGSMGDSDFATALSEIQGIVKATGVAVTFLACDTEASVPRQAATIAQIKAAMVGGGGTNMTPAFEAAAKLTKPTRPDLVICLTDGYIGGGHPHQAPQGQRVIWVITGANRRWKAPWGETLYATKDQE